MNALFINILASLTAFLLVFFSVFLLFHKKGKRISNLLLSAFLFSNGIYIINFLLRQYSTILSKSILYLIFICFNVGFLFGPLLYVYTLSVIWSNFKFEKKYIFHFIPFITSLLLIYLSYYFYPISSQLPEVKNSWSETWSISALLMNIQILIYMGMCLKLINSYSKEAKQRYSSAEKLNTGWLRIIILAFFIMWIIDLLSFTLTKFNMQTHISRSWFHFFSILVNFVFANVIIYKSLQYSELFNGIVIGEEKKYRKSTLRKEEKEKIAQQIKCYLESNRAYLNPNISLLDLSSSLNINSKYISQTINEKFNQNFFEFINSYRIKYAKELMKDSERKSCRILEILYESGFNSKSAFNNAFKKFTGVTPSQYKNQNLISK